MGFFSLFRGKKMPLLKPASCFLSISDLWWIISKGFIGFIRKTPQSLPCFLPVLGCAGFPGTSWHKRVWFHARNYSTSFLWYNQHFSSSEKPPTVARKPPAVGTLKELRDRVLGKGKRMDFCASKVKANPKPGSDSCLEKLCHTTSH